jgi:hypothetical protein
MTDPAGGLEVVDLESQRSAGFMCEEQCDGCEVYDGEGPEETQSDSDCVSEETGSRSRTGTELSLSSSLSPSLSPPPLLVKSLEVCKDMVWWAALGAAVMAVALVVSLVVRIYFFA